MRQSGSGLASTSRQQPASSEHRRLRLLCLSLESPLPADTGDTMRVYGLLRSLAARHDVGLICVRRAQTDERAVATLEGLLSEGLHLFPPLVAHQAGRRARVQRWVRAILQGEPPWLWSHWHEDVAQYVGQIRAPYDAVLFLDNAVTIYWPLVCVDAPLIVDMHNVAGWSVGRAATTQRATTPRQLVRSAVGTWLMRRSERRSVGAMTGVVVTSDEERTRLYALYGRAADAVIPSGINLSQAPLRDAGSGTVGWLGGLGYPPNRDGLVRFVSHGWAPLAEAGYRLLVAGAHPSPDVLSLSGHKGVEILGFVDDLEGFLGRLDVAVVPLWSGAGVKLKTVTFLGAGIPLVTTPVGAEGTGVQDGVHALVRFEPKDLGQGIQELLEDASLAAQIGASGRSLVATALTWSRLGQEFVATVERIVSDNAPTA